MWNYLDLEVYTIKMRSDLLHYIFLFFPPMSSPTVKSGGFFL